jgi:cell wall-associated NlpC family hydrolase
MMYAICAVSAAPVRKEPSHRTEMVNQLLFGDTVQIIEEKEEWLKIITVFDNYEGWVTNHMLTAINETEGRNLPVFIASGLTNPVMHNDQLITAPMGSSLTGFNDKTRLLWDKSYLYQGNYKKMGQPFDKELLLKLVQLWINAPYMWGGKTYLGVDCSGFVQTVFKVLGVQLKRDAFQQAEQGMVVNTIEEVQTGDLAFFVNSSGKIVHVGILLHNSKIVHASGKVRIDPFDKIGIVNKETGNRTHTLHSIKRVI